MTDLHPDDNALLALALDDVDDSKRESTLRHLSTCQRCRNDYDAFTATIEQTFAAAPNVEPPPGYDARMLTAMGLSEVAAGRPRTRRQRWQLVAAPVVVGLGLGAGGAMAVAQINDSSRVTLAEGSSYLETGDGERVGTVTSSYLGSEPVLVVTVTGGKIGMEYRCLLRLEDGDRLVAASWVLESRQGATWVVATPEESVTAVVLVANGGAGPVWSKARL